MSSFNQFCFPPEMETAISHPAGNAENSGNLDEEYSRLDRLCLEALRHEVMAWPKPGLVSPVDSGSHRDMHLGTFFASIAALQGSFAELARAGETGSSFPVLQAIGLEAERKMLIATGGVNTHRGAIFNLGLLAAAAARRRSDKALAGLACGEVVAGIWGAEILATRKESPASHGNHVFRRFAAGGARVEAAAGFPTVYSIGLPVLRRLLQAGHDRETALIGTLMTLMEYLPDTNVLWRDGEAGLDFVRGSAADFNRSGGVDTPGWQARLLVLHRAFMARNLSPGGSADLVAVIWVVHQLETLRAQVH
jgi:triphosphoribosyl-dephospho-CoA synthase